MLPDTTPVKFQCTGCGIWLSAPPSQAPVSGPCPACGAVLTAPESKTRAPVSKRRKGRIAADSAIDHEDLEKRETLQTLKIFFLFALVIGCCVAAAWFLKRWMAG